MRSGNVLLLTIPICGIFVYGILLSNATVAPANELSIKITSPTPGEHMPLSFQINGTMAGELPEDHYLWIMVNPRMAFAQWWPQGGYSIVPGETWYGPVLIGREINQGGEADIGKEFDIAVVLVDEKINKDFLFWGETGDKTRNWPSIRFPEGAKIMAKVTVVRK